MVESLSELNKLCQKPQYQEVGNWMVRKILRPAALPITWLLLHTNVSANQVTLAALLIGLLGVFFLALKSAGFFLAGTLLLQLWYLLDHVDGQIARYRKTACLSGRFFDFLMHHLLHGVLLFALGLFAYFQTRHFIFVLWGFASSISVIVLNMIHDIKYKTFFEKLENCPELARRAQAPPAKTASEPASKGGGLVSLIHKTLEMHVMMNTLTFLAFLQFFFLPAFDTRLVIFPVYGLAAPLFAIAKTGHWILARKIDSDFEKNFPSEKNS